MITRSLLMMMTVSIISIIIINGNVQKIINNKNSERESGYPNSLYDEIIATELLVADLVQIEHFGPSQRHVHLFSSYLDSVLKVELGYHKAFLIFAECQHVAVRAAED